MSGHLLVKTPSCFVNIHLFVGSLQHCWHMTTHGRFELSQSNATAIRINLLSSRLLTAWQAVFPGCLGVTKLGEALLWQSPCLSVWPIMILCFSARAVWCHRWCMCPNLLLNELWASPLSALVSWRDHLNALNMNIKCHIKGSNLLMWV